MVIKFLLCGGAGSGEIQENSVQDSPTPDLSIQQSAKYRVPSGFIDEMLDSLVISDRMSEGCQSLLKSVDLSDLPSTKYRVPSGFIDEMLDGLVISDGALERCRSSMTSVYKLVQDL